MLSNLKKESSSFGSDKDYVSIPFTPALKEFHHRLTEYEWKKKIPECVFIRDYENLPISSSFDIDLMANESAWPALVNVLKSTAEVCDLIFLYRTSHVGLYVLVFDVNQETGMRCWSYYEVHKRLHLSERCILTANDIELSKDEGLPVPTKSWRFFLSLHQGLRKGKIDKYKVFLTSMLDEDAEVQNLCCERLGLSTEDIQSIISAPENLDRWREKTGVRYAVGKTPPSISKISKLKKKLSNKFYIWNTKGPMLFTLHGPDGVGKTTVIQEISDIINEYPFAHEVFHHITSWKKKGNLVDNAESLNKLNIPSNIEAVTFWRKMIRLVYRNLSPAIQEIWIHSSNYIKYSSNLNRHILNYFYNHKVIVCDRYIYDLWAKHQVTTGYLKILHPLHYFFCRIIRLPTRAFIITDEPSEIYKRKQELSLNQITQYQKVIENIINRIGVPKKKISVSGRLPKEIAQEIVEIILEDIEPDVFNFIREEVAKVKLEVKN